MGLSVGELVGLSLGISVGNLVSLKVGIGVGICVGLFHVGKYVGECVSNRQCLRTLGQKILEAPAWAYSKGMKWVLKLAVWLD